VNDDNNIGTFIQLEPKVDINKYGKFVVCWMDERNGDVDIFAQRFDSLGNPVGENFRVNDDQSSAFQSDQDVCIFDDGSFVICWIDYRNDSNDPDVYAQKFDNMGNPKGNNFRVNDDGSSIIQSFPAMDGANDGFFVVCWEDQRYGSQVDQIYAQRFNTSGDSIGGNFLVNTQESGLLPCQYPDVSVQDNHSFIICWEDIRYGDYYSTEIFMQIYNPAGSPIERNYDVVDDLSNIPIPQNRPKVSVNKDGYCVICWIDGRAGSSNPDIYAQRLNINSGGGFIGDNFKSNIDKSDTSYQIYPDVSVSDDTIFVISWIDFRNGSDNPDIYVQTFDKIGCLYDYDMKVNDDNIKEIQYFPAVSIVKDGNFVICWEDERSGDGDIYIQRFKSNAKQGKNTKVNDDVGVNQSNPKISVSSDGKFVVTWDDKRNGESNIDIYYQLYNASAEKVENNTIAHNDTTKFFQTYSDVSFLNDSIFVICWEDHRNGLNDPDIYFQSFVFNGKVIGSNTRVNDEQAGFFQLTPRIDSFIDGSFIICWSDNRNGSFGYDIFAQRYDPSGVPNGVNFRVNDDIYNDQQSFPSVGVSQNGFHTMVWTDTRSYRYDIYAQRYDSLKNKLNNNFVINDDDNYVHEYPDIGYASDGSFVICWEDGRSNDNLDIYAQRFNNNRNKLGDNFKVNDDQSNASQRYPQISVASDGSFVICWEDGRNGTYNPDIYAQCYDRDGKPVKKNIRVNSDQTLRAQTEPNVDMDDNKNMYFVWRDNRISGQGFDIFAKIISWDIFTEVSEKEILENIPTEFVLYQNYPNPFNSETTIKYKIPLEEYVNLKICDIFGVIIKTIVDERQHPGIYSIQWNGMNGNNVPVSSGIYFVNLNVGKHKMTKKIILLK
jgi:hypothetical protein